MDFTRLKRAWKSFVVAPVLSRIRPVVKTRFGDRFVRVDLRDRIIGRTLYLYGSYEPELQRLMNCMNLRGGVCVDVGANIGLHTIVMSELVGNEGKVLAFEPEAHNFQLLQDNLRSNGCDNVRLFNCAVSDSEGVARIELNPINYGDHRIATKATNATSSQEVKITTLDKALSDLPDGVVRFIKIDVQGHETNVLRGMTQTLRRNADAILMVEVSPDILPQAGSSATELMRFFYEQGFEGWELQDYRVFPSLAPWTYELIREQRWADVIFSLNKKLLRHVMSDYCGKEIPFESDKSVSAS